jgi:hypothetical protein
MKIKVQQLLEYHVYYGDSKSEIVEITNLISQVSRDTLLQFSITIHKYIGISLENIDLFKSKSIQNRFA